MNNILTGLIVCSLSLITSNINSQPDCTPADKVVAQVSNVFCDPITSDLSFDLTLTVDGTPVETNTADLEFLDNTTNTEIQSLRITSEIINNFPITISGSCPGINSMHILFENNPDGSLTCKPALTIAPANVAVPTLGEWGLIVLFLSLMIMGLVAIRDPSFLARKAI